MDLNDIKNQVSNLSLYDIKAGWRKAQNAVMNYTEMEAKVREATNNEPWGASSSLMQDIANGTFNYSTLSEIMPMIYKRFTEKSAEEWRQIYKALQLLEFLIKNGSERVIDDARSHLSLLKMLRQFHFVDQNGKDQGINVRNRAKELADLLGDVERIRIERKKARTTRNKYTGAEGGMGLGGGMSSGSRYGGFGGETGSATNYGGYSGGVYGDGGGFGGQSAGEEYEPSQARRERFEEYDEYDDGGVQAPPGQRRANRSSATPKSQPPKPKQPEVDLFDFGEDDLTPSAPAAVPLSNGKAQSAPAGVAADAFGTTQSSGADDDFDDFQAAPSAAPYAAPSQPVAQSSNGAGGFPILSPPMSGISSTQPTRPTSAVNYGAFKGPGPAGITSPPTASVLQPSNQAKPSGYQPQGPNYYGSVSAPGPTPPGASTPSGIVSPTAPGKSVGTGMGSQAKKPATSGDPFASLAMGGAKKPAAAGKGLSMADMAKQKASQGIWGAPAQQQQGGSSASGDLI